MLQTETRCWKFKKILNKVQKMIHKPVEEAGKEVQVFPQAVKEELCLGKDWEQAGVKQLQNKLKVNNLWKKFLLCVIMVHFVQ